jgi:hypothetical protein
VDRTRNPETLELKLGLLDELVKTNETQYGKILGGRSQYISKKKM